MAGRILKAVRPSGPIVRREVLSAAEQAARILDECEAECRRLREQARSEGWAEGFGQWQTALHEAQQAAETYRASLEPELGRLAVRIASKVIGEVVEADRNRVNDVVRQAFRGVIREKQVTIRVAPGFAAVVEPHIDELRDRLAPGCVIRVTESPDVDPGGCVLMSDLGVIDARVETQLAQIERALTGART